MAKKNQHTTPDTWPKTVEKAVLIIFNNLDEAGLHLFSNTSKVELITSHYVKENIIVGLKTKFGLSGWNEELLSDCE